MSATRFGVQPFYFKSYDRTIGIARDTNELHRELTRLAQVDPRALEYHIKQGHITRWLADANENELAEQLKGVKSIEQTRIIVGKYLESTKFGVAKEPPTVAHKENKESRKNTGRKKRSTKDPQKSASL